MNHSLSIGPVEKEVVFLEQSCATFLQKLASKDPAPGGGGAAALVAALGAALGNMVANLTLGKKKYADVEKEIKEILEKMMELQEQMLSYVQKDADAFLPLIQAYALPAENEDQKQEKNARIQRHAKNAAKIPLQLMELCTRAIRIHQDLLQKGTVLAVSDIGVGVLCLKAALESASLNVRINLKTIKDQTYVARAKEQMALLLESYCPLADEVYQEVLARLA